MEVICTDGLSERAKRIILANPPSTARLMTLTKKELRTALQINRVRCKSRWNKFAIAYRLRFMLCRRRRVALQGAIADQPAQEPVVSPNNRCMICMDVESTHVFTLCMHYGVCEGCKNNLQVADDGYPFLRCPYCRAAHNEGDIKKIYFVRPMSL